MRSHLSTIRMVQGGLQLWSRAWSRLAGQKGLLTCANDAIPTRFRMGSADRDGDRRRGVGILHRFAWYIARCATSRGLSGPGCACQGTSLGLGYSERWLVDAE